MKKMLKNSIGTIVDVTLGGAAMKVVGDSSMPSGFKEVTQIGIGAGVMGRTLGRNKKWL